MAVSGRRYLYAALICLAHAQTGAAVPRPAQAERPTLTPSTLFEDITRQVQVLSYSLEQLDTAVREAGTIQPPSTTSAATTASTSTTPEKSTQSPTDPPTQSPTDPPTDPPTPSPTDTPTPSPTETPTPSPTDTPTPSPTETPTPSPTDTPTPSPTDTPTPSPTDTPTPSPTDTPAPSPTGPANQLPEEAQGFELHNLGIATNFTSQSMNPKAARVSYMLNMLDGPAESDECPTPDLVNETLNEASQALEKVAHEEFTQETLEELVDSTTKVNNTVECVKKNHTQFTDYQKNSVQVSIKNAEKSVDKADDIIDNIVNPTPTPLPSLALSSPFVIALITLSCLLAVGTLVGVALTVHRSVRTPPRRRRPRPTVTGRVNAGYRPADTDTTELVERPVGRRRAPAPAPVPEPEGYDRLYQGAIPRAHTVDRPGSEPQQTPRREFYNAY